MLALLMLVLRQKLAGFAQAQAWTAGIKFLPNSNMRFMLNYVILILVM